jgi:hypothetical protein
MQALDTKITGVKTVADAAATQAALTGVVADYKAADASIISAATALTTRVTTAETAIAANKNTQDRAISSAIAEWAGDRAYQVNNICIKNKAFFIALVANTGKDPLVDASGAWGVFNPGSSSDIFANRSPTNRDVQPPGTKFWDVSFGADTPLGFISLGGGAWQFLNQISLSRIRIHGNGSSATYRSQLTNLKIYRSDDTVIPNNWFVWGNGTSMTKPGPGTAFTAQAMQAQYNAVGWGELEPSSLFDITTSISKITGNLWYQGCTRIEFYFSNGGVKTYTSGASGGSTAVANVTLINCDPAQPCRYGDSVASVLGQTLTAAQLSNANSLEVGRLTGEAFVAAVNTLYQAQPQVLATYQQATIDALIARIAALEAKLP